MLVYGDIEHSALCHAVRSCIAEKMTNALTMPAGLARHAQLVDALIVTGQLVQGLLDQAFEANGVDNLSDVAEAGRRLLLAQARTLIHSWRAGFAGAINWPDQWTDWLAALDSADPVRMKTPEGYAFYALYPEAYAEAAIGSGLGSRTVIIGLRSIGTSLAAMVGAALGSDRVYTVRPTGHPFARTLQIGEVLAARLLADRTMDFAIVDEGPGLSGSSFGCVTDWLEAHGVAHDQIHFFPSHSGDLGPQASDAHRARWLSRPRHVVSIDALIIDTPEPAHHLRTWVEAATGARIISVEDISGGRWRDLQSARTIPPSDSQMEKRKFLMRSHDRGWLVKFSGMGEMTAGKAKRACHLSDAGFTPPLAATVHGFVVEAWIDGTPLQDAPIDRTDLIAHLGAYLACRAGTLPSPDHGASLADLRQMAVFNTQQAVNLDAGPTLDRLMSEDMASRLRRIDSDNRLHIWEWRVDRVGNILKTDALDHNKAHDLVGAQDLAWDIAGAVVEFNLSSSERDRLLGHITEKTGYDPQPDILMVFEIFYLAFQIGLWTFATGTSDAAEAKRTLALIDSYKARMCECLRPDYAIRGGASAAK